MKTGIADTTNTSKRLSAVPKNHHAPQRHGKASGKQINGYKTRGLPRRTGPGFLRAVAVVAFTIGLCLGVFAQTNGDTPTKLTIAFTGGDLTLDPLHSYRTTELQIATGIYEGLVSYDPETLQPVPGVAYRWEISENARRYEFFLRKRARFSNGDPVTAEDFRQSWLRILDPEDEGEYSFLFDVIAGARSYRKGETDNPVSVGIKAPDPQTLIVELEQPAAHFLSMLAHMTFVPVHESYRNRSGWEWSAPLITNGAFSPSKLNGDTLLLEKNPQYWDHWNVALSEIGLDFSDDTQAITESLLNDQVHWAVTADMSMLEDDRYTQVSPLFATSYLYFRSDSKPWNDERVRKGLALLVRWNQIRSSISQFPTSTLVPRMGDYPEVTGLEEQNVQKGLELLEEAGFPEGRGLPTIVFLMIPGTTAAQAATQIATAWREYLSVDVDMEMVAWSEYSQRVEEGGFTVGSSTWIGDFADPLAFLQMWTAGSRLNDARFAGEGYDRIIDKAMSELDEERYKLLAEAEEKLLTDDVVVLPLAHTLSVNFIDREKIGGWYPNLLDVHPFKYLRFREPDVPLFYALSDPKIVDF